MYSMKEGVLYMKMTLSEHNKQILEEFKILPHLDTFAYPLLVSTNPIYLENLKLQKTRILYIGQETNQWVNYRPNSVFTQEAIEGRYYEFLNEQGPSRREFWQFIRHILKKDDVGNNVIWNNTLIAGRKEGLGCPEHYQELEQLSLKNLIFLYQYFKPELTILASGPNNPYYHITNTFLKNLDSSLQEKYPTIKNPLLEDKNHNILWTYHPNFLHRKHIQKDIEEHIHQKYIKKI